MLLIPMIILFLQLVSPSSNFIAFSMIFFTTPSSILNAIVVGIFKFKNLFNSSIKNDNTFLNIFAIGKIGMILSSIENNSIIQLLIYSNANVLPNVVTNNNFFSLA